MNALLAAVFFLSLSSFAFEVLLARIFSVTQWNHLSFMVISIALFGFAASGTFLSVPGIHRKGWETRLSKGGPVAAMIVMYAVSATGAVFAVNRIPLDYFRIPLEPVQIVWLGAVYLLLSLPFFFTGLAVAVAFASHPDRSGAVYFSTMSGSACGAVLPALLLPLAGDSLVILVALAPLPVIFLTDRTELSTRKRVAVFATGIVTATVAGFILLFGGFQIKPSPYKAASQMLQFPDTETVGTAVRLTGRTDRVESPYIRFAPSLSLKYAQSLPKQSAIYTDGDNPFVFYDLKDGSADFSEFTLSKSGYILAGPAKRVLLIVEGGGSSIPCALASGAKDITVVARNPDIAGQIEKNYRDFGLRVVNAPPRAFLAGNSERYSIIHVENWGASLPGTAALNQEHLLTVDAFAEYFGHLTGNGVFVVSRKLILPPSDAIRIWAAAYESLRGLGHENPEKHLVMLRNWDTFTLAASTRPIAETAKIRAFARSMNFDPVWFPGIKPGDANRFNVFEKSYHYNEIAGLARAFGNGTEKARFDDCFIDVAPQTDARPFPSRFLKWSGARELYKSTGSRFYSILMSGEVVVAVVFLEALAVALLLLVAPLIVISRKGQKVPLFQIVYFLSVGAGFMFTELFFIKQYTLLFGHPLISFTVVLSGILIFSSFGALLSEAAGPRGLIPATFFLAFLLFLSVVFVEPLIGRILGLPEWQRYVFGVLILVPPGVLMGLPFTLGMRHLLENPAQRAYAWATNGCASVLTSILAAQVAISAGMHTILWLAAATYLAAFFALVFRD